MQSALVLALLAASAAPVRTAPQPRVDHLLFEVANLDASIQFYRDRLGLRLSSRTHDFATLEAANVQVALWQGHWDWEAPRAPGKKPGVGLYPHLEVKGVAKALEALRAAGVPVVQAPRAYDWGTEAFISDPDGYVWALVELKK